MRTKQSCFVSSAEKTGEGIKQTYDTQNLIKVKETYTINQTLIKNLKLFNEFNSINIKIYLISRNQD